MFSGEHCPLFQKDLNLFQRLMYCSGVWSYIVGAITTPVFNAIPLVTIWAGVFPIVVSWWAAGDYHSRLAEASTACAFWDLRRATDIEISEICFPKAKGRDSARE